MEELIQLPGKLIIAGDFNIHVENLSDHNNAKLTSVLNRYGLSQHVTSPTHIGGGILDLIITRDNASDSIDISDINVLKTVTSSDHFLVTFSCNFPHQLSQERIPKPGRKLKEIDRNLFKEDIISSDLNDPLKYIDCETAVDLYNSELSRILDKHAPLTHFTISPNESKWINKECQEARRKRRKAERDNVRLNTPESRATYNRMCKHCLLYTSPSPRD